MRYVIGVLFVTGLIVWDGVHHDGRHLDGVIRSLQSGLAALARMI